MQNEKIDRRIERTRQLIREALVSLILEKGYERVTVQDIIDRANVGRSTFYAHFQDKEDLLLRGVAEIAYGDDMEQRVSEDVSRLGPAGSAGRVSALPVFEHIQRNQRLHKAMFVKNNEDPILVKGMNFLYANMKAQLERLVAAGEPTRVPLPLAALFLTGGLMALLKWWLENDMPYSPLEMDQFFQRLAMPEV